MTPVVYKPSKIFVNACYFFKKEMNCSSLLPEATGMYCNLICFITGFLYSQNNYHRSFTSIFPTLILLGKIPWMKINKVDKGITMQLKVEHLEQKLWLRRMNEVNVVNFVVFTSSVYMINKWSSNENINS